jgi:WD40 repeat protein
MIIQRLLLATFLLGAVSAPHVKCQEPLAIRPISHDTVPTSAVRTIAICANKKRMAISGDATDLRFFDLSTSKRIQKLSSPTTETYFSLDYSPDGKTLAAGTTSGVHIWDAERFTQVTGLNANPPIAFSRNGKILFTGSPNARDLIAWSVDTWKKSWTVPHEDRICALKVSDDNRYLATVTLDTPTLRVWDLNNFTAPPLILPDQNNREAKDGFTRVDRIQFSHDGKTLVMQYDESTYIARLKNKTISKLADIQMVYLEARGLYVGVGLTDNTLHIRDAKTNKEIHQIKLKSEHNITLPKVVSLSADGSLLAIGNDSGDVVVLKTDDIVVPSEREKQSNKQP